MSFESISWVFVTLSLLGNFFVIQKNVLGQWFWTVGNVGWVAFNLYNEAYSQAFLFAVYFMMSVYGIIAWTKEAKLQKA